MARIGPVPREATVRRARAAIAADAVAGHDPRALLERVAHALGRVVPFDAAGFTTTDPDTLLWTGGLLVGLPQDAMSAYVETELLGDDVLSLRDLCAAGRPVGRLSEATGDEPERSLRYRRIYRPHGMAAELRVAFLSGGRCYGTACLLREDPRDDFTAREAAFIASVSAAVAEGLRASLAGARDAWAAPGRTGVLVVDDDGNVVSSTDVALEWLAELPGDDGLPTAVKAVVLRARDRASGRPGPPARSRVRTASGAWLSIEASPLSGGGGAWAVLLDPARPSDALALAADGHDLTAREREVLALLLRGLPDKAIAERLVVSPHTAREHAGRVLRKFGVRTRAELQALLFEEHYEPWLAVAATN